MRKIIFALAFGVILLPDYGFTLGLGEIEVSTALNQELNAEIELLSAAPEDVETLIVKLASRDEFSRAGIDRPYLLSSLKFNAEMRNGVPIIRVTSDKPIREPFLNFLVEIDWPKGHMMREYTILLDPPVFMGQQQAPSDSDQTRPAALDTSPSTPATAPDPQGGSGFRPSAIGATAGSTASAPVPMPGVRAQAVPSQQVTSQAAVPTYTQATFPSSSGYRIQPGDTLWSLADALRPDQSVTIEQMMLAILRTNPEAFIEGNINGLKRGYILRVPERDEITGVNTADAVARVREQHALWREYQQTMTSDEPTSAVDREAEADAGSGFSQDSDARLEIVAAGSGVSASGSKDPTQMNESELRAELSLARESLETERVEKEELQQRVAALEGQVDRMKSLLTLEDTDMAEMQQAVTPAEVETLPADESFSDVEPEGFAEEADIAEQALSDLESEADGLTAAEQALLEEEEAAIEEETLLDEGVEQEEVFIEEDLQDMAEEADMAEEVIEPPVTSTEDFTVEPAPQPAFMQQKQGLLATLLNNPVLLAAAGGGLLLVLLLIALIMRRRRSGGDEDPTVESNLDAISDDLDEADASALDELEQDVREEPEQAVAAAESAVEKAPAVAAAETPSSAEDTAVAATTADADESTRDDVIAEADVYLAYGIYQQAEELLQNAIKQDPDNDSYRLKLAETYLASKNSDAFIELATDMNRRREGKETAAWKKIEEIGMQLTPGHAVFKGAGADMVDELTMDELSSQKPESMDIELGDEAGQEELAPDLDLGVDESEIAAEPEEIVEFDLAETGADTLTDENGDGLEFDLADAGAEEVDLAEESAVEFDIDEAQALETAESDEDEFALDIEADELGISEQLETEAADTDFELDLGAEADEILAAADGLEDGGQEEQEFSLDDVDAASLGLDVAEDEPEEFSAEDEAAILDLDDAVVETAAEPEIREVGAETTSFADDDELDLSDLDDIDEVGTKLDLAKAYLDMGDADGTRSILDEVMSEGDDTQKREAEELLRQIG